MDAEPAPLVACPGMRDLDENGCMRIEPHTLIALVVAVAAEYGRGPEVNRHYIVAFIDGFLARAKQESS